MKECYGKNGFHYNVEESFHMGGTTEAPFHGSAMGGKTCFYSNIEEKDLHGGRHGGASWKKIVSILTLRKTFQMGGVMGGKWFPF